MSNDIDFGQENMEKANSYHSNHDNVVNLVIENSHLKAIGN